METIQPALDINAINILVIKGVNCFGQIKPMRRVAPNKTNGIKIGTIRNLFDIIFLLKKKLFVMCFSYKQSVY